MPVPVLFSNLSNATGAQLDANFASLATQTTTGQLIVDQSAHTDSGTPFASVTVRTSHQGTITGTTPQYNFITINSDTADASTSTNNPAAFEINDNFGGADPTRANALMAGGRTGFRTQLTQTGQNLGHTKEFVAGEFWTTATANMGGTDFSANVSGGLFGINPQAIAQGGATFLYGLTGGEVNFAMFGGASARNKVGLQIIQLSQDTTAGSGFGGANPVDALLYLGQQRPTGLTNTIPPMIYAIRIGDIDSQWPLGSNSTIMGVVAQTIANGGGAPTLARNANLGIDFSNVTFVSGAFKSTGFLVDGIGGVSGLYVKTTGNIVAANGATTSYTYPNDTAYVYLTTTAVSMAMTLPAAAAELDGFIMTVCPSANVATVTWASSGATFVGAPATFTANVAVRMKYIHAQTAWYPA